MGILVAVSGLADLVRNVDATFTGKTFSQVLLETSDGLSGVLQASACRLAIRGGFSGVVQVLNPCAATCWQGPSILQVI